MGKSEAQAEANDVVGEMMKYRGILFSAPMVRAILEGRKTQTRRVIRLKWPKWPGELNVPASIHPDGSGLGWIAWWPNAVSAEETARQYPGNEGFLCSYGVPGDRLWVRETWSRYRGFAEDDKPDAPCLYRADLDYCGQCPCELRNFKHMNPDTGAVEITEGPETVFVNVRNPWRPSIFMPRALSRITLEITDVRAERMQDISEEDAAAEGCHEHAIGSRESARGEFCTLWDSINAKRGYSWESNPWVWALTFRRLK